jgi:chemotaxis protein CheY-P-specific phosphatase CheC
VAATVTEEAVATSAAAEPPPARPEASEAPSPPPSLRVKTETLDRFLGTVGEVILSSSQLRTASRPDGAAAAPGVAVGLDRMDRAVADLQRRALELRTTPLQRIVEPLPRMAREIAQRVGKRVEVEIRNAEIELDRSILDRLSDPLVHIFRNAVDHGIEEPALRLAAGKPEAGRIVVDARREKDLIHIAVRDDGAGIDLDALRARAVEAGIVVSDLAEDLPPEEVAALVFQPGLSTAESVSDISGRGVGMDAVRATIQSLGGHIELATERGRGTTMTLVVPITAAVQRVLLLGVSDEIVAIPIAKVERILEIADSNIERAGQDAFTLVDDDPLPVISLAEQLAFEPREAREVAVLVLADVRGEVMALQADSIVGQQQIYVKPVPELLAPRGRSPRIPAGHQPTVMTRINPPRSQAEIDQLCTLASIGAGFASTAFSLLLGGTVLNRAPRVCGPGDPTESDRWCTGIVFEAEGDMTGLVAIVLPAPDRDLAVQLMVGYADPHDELVESALRELGNIIASHTVSAIADSLDATILLSVPTLVMEDAGAVLTSLIDQRGAEIRVETDLYRPDGALGALLVFVPDAPKPGPL